MSAPKHRYELWYAVNPGGKPAARYKTLGQALLGALWRARELGKVVYVYEAAGRYVCSLRLEA